MSTLKRIWTMLNANRILKSYEKWWNENPTPLDEWEEWLEQEKGASMSKTILLSGQGRSGIGQVIAKHCAELGFKVMFAGLICDETIPAPDVAISLGGYIVVERAEDVTWTQVEDMWQENYAKPRAFIEQALRLGAKLIIVMGSIAARYGNVNAEDYAATKAALGKYVELRARTAREQGARIVLLNLGAVATGFWNAVEDEFIAIKPDMEKALTADEVAQTVISVIELPERVCPKEIVLVSREYQ